MKLEITVCNVCKAIDRPTREYTVKSGDRIGKTELCEEHGAPFEAVLPPLRGRKRAPAKSTPPPAKTTTRRTRRNGTPIMTLEEIAARKAQQAS